jgi:uncharacterized protein (DUF1778 family)
MAQSGAVRSDAVMNVRVPAATRDLIDDAAAIVGKSRSEFVLDSAKREAIDVLLDQRLITLSADAMARFEAVLENPPAPTAALRRLMAQKAPWER